MAVDVLQLLLDVAADAASVVPVQPLPHNAHAVLTLLFVKGKVLDLGGDATPPTRMALFVACHRRPGCSRNVLTGAEENHSRIIEGES